MRIVILGGSGMLGHTAYKVLSAEFDTYATFKKVDTRLKNTGLFDPGKICDGVDAFKFKTVCSAIDSIKPQVVLNCIGIIKQNKDIADPKAAIYINALFPHLLAEQCEYASAKMIHISTDCVFSGKKGDYTEEDMPDDNKPYGRTKFLGEVGYGNNITLRTSIIGRELFTGVSLVDWFLSQRNKKVNGYTNAIYTGLTASALCKEIARIIKSFSSLKGLYHVSAEKISKYDLLKLINEVYKLNITVVPYEDFRCDRSLNSGRYRRMTDFVPKSWPEMITDMYKEGHCDQRRDYDIQG